MGIARPWRAEAFAKQRPAASISACGGSVSFGGCLMSGLFLNSKYPLRSGLWHPLNVSLPPRPPPSGGLQHGDGPAGCAVLLKARFDRRLDCCTSGGLGGEEGCAADRASAMLELPLGGGSGERHVQRMPGPGRRDPLTSAYSKRAASFHIAECFVSHEHSTALAGCGDREETTGAASWRGGGRRDLHLPPGRGKAGMGVECRHSAGQVSTPSPARPADRAKPKAWPSDRRVGPTGPKHVRPQPLPGGGSQNFGRENIRRQVNFHNAKRFVS